MKQEAGQSSAWWRRLRNHAADSGRRVGTAAAVIIAGLLGYHAVAGNNGLTVYKQKLIEDKQLAAEVKQMEEQNDRLKKHVDHPASDPDAIEFEAHRRLRYTRPGQVIVLSDDPAMPRQGQSAQK